MALLLVSSSTLHAKISSFGGGGGGGGIWPVSGTPTDLLQKNSSGTITGSYQLNSNTSFYGPVQISSTVKMFTLSPDDQWILESSDISNPANMRLGSNGGTQGGFFHFSTSLGIDRLKFGYADSATPGLSFTTLAGANKLFIASNGNIGINTNAPSALIHISSPAGTVGVMLRVTTGTTNTFEAGGSSVTANVPMNATSYYSNGKSLFISSSIANGYDGYNLFFTSGAIAANTQITISTSSVPGGGVSIFGIPICVEIEGVNTAVLSVRLKSIAADLTSFIVYNADVANAKNYGCMVPVKK